MTLEEEIKDALWLTPVQARRIMGVKSRQTEYKLMRKDPGYRKLWKKMRYKMRRCKKSEFFAWWDSLPQA